MMQAAQLAAEAAMQEAAREESASRSSSRQPHNMMEETHHHHHHHLPRHHHSEMDLQYDDEDSGMNPEQIAFLRAVQAAEMGGQASLLRDLGIMGLGNGANDNVHSLLQMMAQHDQETRRPEEHYLTIAQNGALFLNSNNLASELSAFCGISRLESIIPL